MRWVACLVLAGACGRFGFTDHAALTDGAGSGTDDGALDAPVPHNRAFVTSTTFTIPFAGLTAADAACQAAADSRNLGGTFQALLGTSTMSPLSRFSGARGWIDLAGAPLVDDPAGWTDGSMRRPLRRDERGMELAYDTIWLGGSSNTCSDFSVTTGLGSIAFTTNYFTEFDVGSCANPRHFACLESAYAYPLQEPAQAGRIAFETIGTWSPSGGLAGADAFCNASAVSSSQPGSYKAVLATTTASALSRFTFTGPTWTTVEGIPIVATAADAPNTTSLLAFVRTNDDHAAWGSAATWAWSGNTADNCLDWMDSSAGQVAMTGDASSADRAQFFTRQSYGCNAPRPLICLQE